MPTILLNAYDPAHRTHTDVHSLRPWLLIHCSTGMRMASLQCWLHYAESVAVPVHVLVRWKPLTAAAGTPPASWLHKLVFHFAA
jgi:hypothetical protein